MENKAKHSGSRSPQFELSSLQIKEQHQVAQGCEAPHNAVGSTATDMCVCYGGKSRARYSKASLFAFHVSSALRDAWPIVQTYRRQDRVAALLEPMRYECGKHKDSCTGPKQRPPFPGIAKHLPEHVSEA